MGGRILDYEAKTIRNEGRKEGAFDMLVTLVKEGLLAIEEAGRKAGMSLEEFTNKMNQST